MAVFSAEDHMFMNEALIEADRAEAMDEVPVGAVIVVDGKIVGRGYNMKETCKDATLHAEMIALRQACATLGGWRLPNAELYVTLEPCSMCAGAMIQARIKRLVYGAADPKTGAAGSVIDICRNPQFNHQIIVESGLLAEQSSAKLSQFFKKKRG